MEVFKHEVQFNNTNNINCHNFTYGDRTECKRICNE